MQLAEVKSAALLPSHLKCHMFQEMCGAIISLVLIATAGVYPEAHLEEVSNEYPQINTHTHSVATVQL